MIYSPELAKLLQPYVQKVVDAARRQRLLPFKVAAAAVVAVTVPLLAFAAPPLAPAVFQPLVPLSVAAALRAKDAAPRAEAVVKRVEQEVTKAVESGALLDQAAPATPTKGMTQALDAAE